jgi:peptidoglycan/xylan/chitin deacetylase (PgdA/CDA1 family)
VNAPDAVLAAAGAAAAAVAVAHALPAATSWPALRARLLPRLAGIGRGDHVALTFDDGPDPTSTPQFLDELAKTGTKATFFLLGEMLVKAPGLGRELVAAGHEVGVHGFHHRYALLRNPLAMRDDVARARDAVAEATGVEPVWFRPPYGVISAGAGLAARRAGLRTVLWTAWGRDWEARATPASVMATIRKDLRGGGTVLLHDSDCTSSPNSWQRTLGALPLLLDECARRDLAVGTLGEHFDGATLPAAGR